MAKRTTSDPKWPRWLRWLAVFFAPLSTFIAVAPSAVALQPDFVASAATEGWREATFDGPPAGPDYKYDESSIGSRAAHGLTRFAYDDPGEEFASAVVGPPFPRGTSGGTAVRSVHDPTHVGGFLQPAGGRRPGDRSTNLRWISETANHGAVVGALTIQVRSGDELDAHQAGAVLAFIIGALVLGAFAPKNTAGFAAPGLRRLISSMKN